MTVEQLRQMLNGVDGNMEVLIPVNAEFDGMFRSPCIVESGVCQVAENEEDDEEFDEFTPKIDVFMILPHEFSAQREGPDPEQN